MELIFIIDQAFIAFPDANVNAIQKQQDDEKEMLLNLCSASIHIRRC
jgi:hypothetical protein